MSFFFTEKEAHKYLNSCRFDALFNWKTEVACDMAISSEILRRPSSELCQAVAVFSQFIYQLYKNDDSRLRNILNAPQNIEYLEKYLGAGSGYYGASFDGSIVGWIEKVLQSEVSPETIFDHLSIHNKLGCIFWEISTQFRPVEATALADVRQGVLYLKKLGDGPVQSDDDLLAAFTARCEELFPTDDEMNAVRKRKTSPQRPLAPVKVSGILPSRGFAASSSSAEKLHTRGADVWRIDWSKDKLLLDESRKNRLPMISGASGTMARWLSFIELCQFNIKSPEEFTQYAAAAIAYMPVGGHHSWSETAMVCRKLGIDYDPADRFHSVIPATVLSTDKIKRILKLARQSDKQLPHSRSEPFTI